MNKTIAEVARYDYKTKKKKFKKIYTENVRVGDLVKVYKNQEFPADICFLSGSGKSFILKLKKIKEEMHTFKRFH